MERIYQKIGRINEYLDLVHSLQENCLARFQADPLYRGALLHYLYLLSDTCIALAEMVIKQRGLRIPQFYQEAFEILGNAGVLEPGFAAAFSKVASFRNFLAHDYERVEAERICRTALSALPDVEEYIRQIKTALGIE